MKPTFFATPAKFRAWLEKHHETKTEVLVGFHKRGSGRPSLTWPESVAEALCFGWIDGVRKRLDETSYTIRFTPRKPRSIWSAVNIAKVAELTALGLMLPSGLRAFEARSPDKSAIYAYEQRKHAALDAGQERSFRAAPKAWAFFQAQPPWYRRTVTYWVVSAKKPETRDRRLAKLIEYSLAERSIAELARKPKSS